ncbi:hypothetical protein [Sutterella wadsworthensis]|uniref:hypothetical protein n=1 Tax=Sutterella wadsworthensis TaxID=40545 RepID=UPI0032BFAA6E
MIYFKLHERNLGKIKHLDGVSQSRAKKLSSDERKKLLTDVLSLGILTPEYSGNSTIRVEVSDFQESEPFLAYMKASDYVKATTSNHWVNGKYIGVVKLIKNGTECFIAPYLED